MTGSGSVQTDYPPLNPGMSMNNQYYQAGATGDEAQQRPDHFRPDPRFGTDWAEEEAEHGAVLHRAQFLSQQDKYISYVTWKWVLISILCLFMYGFGLFMLMWTPVIRYIARKDIQSRRLFVTGDSLVYKTAKPACCPCCGTNRGEKHVMLSLITDVQISQSWFEAKFDIWSVKVENPGQTGPQEAAGGFDVAIQGIEEPKVFKRLLLACAHAKRDGHEVTHAHVREIIATGKAHELTKNKGRVQAMHGGAAGAGGYETDSLVTAQLTTMNSTLERVEKLLADQAQSNSNARGYESEPSSFGAMNSTLERIEKLLAGQAKDKSTSGDLQV